MIKEFFQSRSKENENESFAGINFTHLFVILIKKNVLSLMKKI
jgi:hypothetical protein